MDESQDDNAAERRHDKPLLTVEQQIAHMKAKGITFELCTEEQRKHLKTELKQRRNDPYAGAVVRKYQDDMPVWAFCGVVSFGTFTDLLRFCADRWDDKRLRRDHYQYKDTRQVRNASAHGLCACAHKFCAPALRICLEFLSW